MIAGFCDYGDVIEMALDIARREDLFVEVGGWLGASAQEIVTRARARAKLITLVSVDSGVGGIDTDENDEKAANPWGGHYERDISANVLDAAGGTTAAPFAVNMVKHGLHEVVQIVATSARAVRFIADSSAAFVYLDASHRYDHMMEDIALWRMKVRPGGILAGHDYDHLEVRQAVRESFALKDIYFEPPRSWLWYRP